MRLLTDSKRIEIYINAIIAAQISVILENLRIVWDIIEISSEMLLKTCEIPALYFLRQETSLRLYYIFLSLFNLIRTGNKENCDLFFEFLMNKFRTHYHIMCVKVTRQCFFSYANQRLWFKMNVHLISAVIWVSTGVTGWRNTPYSPMAASTVPAVIKHLELHFKSLLHELLLRQEQNH